MVKRELRVSVAKTSKAEGLLWVEMEEEEGQRIFLVVVYRAPGQFPLVRQANQELMDELSSDIFYFQSLGKICIVGDFNCRIGEEESRVGSEEKEKSYKRRSEDKVVGHGGRELVNYMNDHNMIILNGIRSKALFSSVQVRGNTVIDYIISDERLYDKVRNFKTWTEEFSIVCDHRFLSIEIDVKLEKENKEKKNKEKKKNQERHKRGWRRRVRDRKKLEDVCESEMKRWCEEVRRDEDLDSETVWQMWLDMHERIAEEAVGRQKRRREWKEGGEWDQGVFELVREKNRLRKKMGRVVGEERKVVVNDYRKCREQVKQILRAKQRRKQQEVNAKLESMRGRDERGYWKYLKNLAGMKKSEEKFPEQVRVGERIERGEKRKEVWNEGFSRLGRFDLDDKNYDKSAYVNFKQQVEQWEREQGERIVGELDGEIEMDEIEKALNKAESNKAAGDDGCVNEILKQGGDGMKRSLLVLFQKVWNEERVPVDWARGIIVPIHKDGERENVDNYRGITLLSVVGKLYTSVLNERVSRWIEKKKKLVEEQGGFRAKRSTTDQIFILKEIVLGRKRVKKSTFTCFLDIRKAYDTVCREALWVSMLEKDIGGKMWRVVKNLYREVGSCVRLGEEKTEWFSLDVGLRQGCILSPILFSIFIDGLAEAVKKVGGAKYGELVVSLLLFADDIVLIAENEDMLQKMLDVVYEYSKKYRFCFNRDKSNVMIFGGQKKNVRRNFFRLGENELQIVNNYKYLGLIVDENFTWKLHLEKMLAKAWKRTRPYVERYR